MLKTLRSQIFFVVMLVTLLAVIIVFYFVQKDAKKIIYDLEKKSIDNVVAYIESSLTDKFNIYLKSQFKSVDRIKRSLKRESNEIKEDTNGNINNIINNYINAKNTRNEVMLLSESGEVLSSTVSRLIDKNVDSFYNLSRKKIRKRYYGTTISRAGQFDGFCLDEERNLCFMGHFIPVAENRTLSVFSSKAKFIDKSKKKIEGSIDELKEILKDIPLSKAGFVFIFNEDGKILIEQDEMYPSTSKNDSCLQEIIEKGKANIGKEIPVESSSCRTRFSLFTEYFKGFDWYFARVLSADELEKPADDLVWKLFFIIISIAFLAVILFILLISRVTKPFAILSRKMERVPEHDFTGDDRSELLDGLPVGAHNEAGQLAETFSFMIKKLSDSIKELVATTAANERMESELNVARKIQLDLLPKDFSEAKRKVGDLHAYLNPAREIGGDLYDFFFIDDEHLCFTVGDVADKGVSAALFMVCAKKMIKSYAVKGGTDRLSPAEITGEINEMLCNDNATATFITLFIGILNVKNGELRYANGGHVPPIFVDCGSEPQYRKDVSGPAVGVRPGFRYKDITTALQPGGVVFLCTDGVTEAMNEEDKLFGDKRLLDDFSSMKDKSCKEVVDGILYEVRMHAGTAPQSDDIAMLMLRWGVKGEDGEDYV